ncbi:MAG: DUF5063 domain-containing protein [Bacteroidaceae bacterium]|nr:DUF5063 domain-containing protein [Bacteroidaceae bacterium]
MEQEKLIYTHDTLEFVTVAVRFCAFLEQSEGLDKAEFTGTLLKMLPLLYLKAQLLPTVESEGDFLPADQVTEQDYDWLRHVIWQVLGDDDQYLDVCYEDPMQTDETQWRSVSEHLADIYQPLRNFLAVYKEGVEDCMTDSLWAVEQSFTEYWGQAAVDAMRRLHFINKRLSEREDDYE